MDYKLLTIVGSHLGISLDSNFYQTIEKLKNYKLKEDSYGMYENVVVSHLAYDGNWDIVCKELFIKYVSKIESLVHEENVDDAVNLYKEMIESLYKRYVDSYKMFTNTNKSIFDNTSLVTSILARGK